MCSSLPRWVKLPVGCASPFSSVDDKRGLGQPFHVGFHYANKGIRMWYIGWIITYASQLAGSLQGWQSGTVALRQDDGSERSLSSLA